MRTEGAILTVMALLFSGCVGGADETARATGETGLIHSALDIGADGRFDVTAIAFKVVAPTLGCDAPSDLTNVARLTASDEPDTLDVSAGRTQRAEALFVVDPGDYRVCASPLRLGGAPSRDCDQSEAVVTVMPSVTVQQVLIVHCREPDTGGLDVPITLNAVPRIHALTVTPDVVVPRCAEIAIAIDASDADGDALSFSLAVVASTTGAPWMSHLVGDAMFLWASCAPGGYLLEITVADSRGGGATARVNVEVVAACQLDSHCPATDYCRFEGCEDVWGDCAWRPTWCNPVVDAPVCGCDGVVYQSACRAAMSDVSVDDPVDACLEPN